jgi:hypothetical protein
MHSFSYTNDQVLYNQFSPYESMLKSPPLVIDSLKVQSIFISPKEVHG